MAQNYILPKEMKFFIPDFIELGIHQRSKKRISKLDFEVLKPLNNQKGKSSGYADGRRFGLGKGTPISLRFHHSRDKQGFLRSTLYLKTNGILLARQHLGLKEPSLLSTDGKRNFILERDFRNIPASDKIHLLDFTLERLPEVLWDLFQQGWIILYQHLKQRIPDVEIHSMPFKSSFSIQNIEIANDVKIRKWFHPTTHPKILENIASFSHRIAEQSFGDNGKTIFPSERIKGAHVLYFWTERYRLLCRSYVKYLGNSWDVFRQEVVFSRKSLRKLRIKCSIEHSSDIQTLIESICKRTQRITSKILHCRYPKLGKQERLDLISHHLCMVENRGKSILRPEVAKRIAHLLDRNDLKFYLAGSGLSKRTQNRISAMADIPESPILPLGTSGQYYFRAELLGSKEVNDVTRT